MPRPQPAAVVPAARYNTTIAVLGGSTRKGLWEVGESHTAFAFCAGIDIDLREARFTSRETVIYANAIWAGIDIVVNEHTNVVVEGIGIMGAFDQGRDKVAPNLTADSPTVRVKGVALMAGRHGGPQADARRRARAASCAATTELARPPRTADGWPHHAVVVGPPVDGRVLPGLAG